MTESRDGTSTSSSWSCSGASPAAAATGSDPSGCAKIMIYVDPIAAPRRRRAFRPAATVDAGAVRRRDLDDSAAECHRRRRGDAEHAASLPDARGDRARRNAPSPRGSRGPAWSSRHSLPRRGGSNLADAEPSLLGTRRGADRPPGGRRRGAHPGSRSRTFRAPCAGIDGRSGRTCRRRSSTWPTARCRSSTSST